MNSTQTEDVLARYLHPLISKAFSILRDRDLAEDVASEAITKLSYLETPIEGRHLEAWLFTVVKNNSIKLGIKQSRLVRIEETEEETGDGFFDRIPDESPTPEQQTTQKEQIERLLSIVDSSLLSKKEQSVVRLRFFENLSYLEIQDRLGISVGNVGFTINYALNKLREKMIYLQKQEDSQEFVNR